MEEMTSRQFGAQVEYDLPSYKEISKATALHSPLNTISLLVVMAIILFYSYLWGIAQQKTATLSLFLILWISVFWGVRLIQAIRNKDGDLAYKRMLSTNNGVPPCHQVLFGEDCIHYQNTLTGNCSTTQYSQLRQIYESKNFLIFIQEHRLFSAIRKDSITGGTEAQLLDFLFEKSTGIKKKKLRSALPGKIVSVSIIVVSVLGALLALWFSSPVQSFLYRQQPINNYMSYQAIAEELEDLGITGIDDALIAELEAYDQEYDYVYSYDFGNKALDMLCWAGMGEYDLDTWEWTPSDSGVYWFDMEVLSPDTMFTDLLTGIRALDPQALNFTNIAEDCPTPGVQEVSFQWNGKSHALKGNVESDWIDMRVVAALAELVQVENTGKQLYFAYDGGQGMLVFYSTPQWSEAFADATGIQLFDDPWSCY